MPSLETKPFLQVSKLNMNFFHLQDGFQIHAQSQSRVGQRGSKATFCVQYVGECEEEGEMTLTYHSNPVMSIRLLFAISNY